MYLTDLVFIHESMQSMERHMINFEKYRTITRVINEIQLYQRVPFNLELLPFVRDYLLNVEALPTPELLNASYQVMPRPARAKGTTTVCLHSSRLSYS